MEQKNKATSPSAILRTLIAGDVLELLEYLAKAAKCVYHWIATRRAQGIYEVLKQSRTVELLDPRGEVAVVTRRQVVRFLQDHVAAITDYAWGDGEIYAEYTCTPGAPVDFYKEGSRHAALISLREAKSRGDTLTVNIRRKILGGFTRRDECWETEVYHRTRLLSLSILFPRERRCQRAVVTQRSTSRTTALGPEQIRYLADGRQRLTWEIRNPKLHDHYTLKWRW